MSDNRTTQAEASSQDGLTSGVRILVAVCAALLIFYFIYALMVDSKPLATVFACALLCAFLLIFIFLSLNPDILRSQYTEQTLSSASEMLEDIKDGLTPEGAEAICRRLLTETRAMAIAMTDDTCVLACAGDLASDFPPGSLIHTPATHYVLEHGIVQSFTHAVDVKSETRGHREIPAGIIAPLKVRGKAVGTLKFYYRRSHEVNRTQYALASGFAELISTQLAIHELELQSELTARAEVRALQAQINPHFLFNTLNTIAALTRTEPLRARELLREFASFYRATLDNSGSLIPVSREIEQTLRYLTFEKARFGEDRIGVNVDIDEEVEDTLVPAFVIQPLVENAVRHAMGDEDPPISISRLLPRANPWFRSRLRTTVWAWTSRRRRDCSAHSKKPRARMLPRAAVRALLCTISPTASRVFMDPARARRLFPPPERVLPLFCILICKKVSLSRVKIEIRHCMPARRDFLMVPVLSMVIPTKGPY